MIDLQRNIRNPAHDRPRAPRHPHHHDGDIAAGLRGRRLQARGAEDLRQDHPLRGQARPRRRGHRARDRHPHRQQAHLRDAHGARRGARATRRTTFPSRRRWTARRRNAASTSSAASPRWCTRASRAGTCGSSARSPRRSRPRSASARSVNVATTRAGINMDAVRLMGDIIKADRRAHRRSGRPRLREARRLLQRRGGQPLHGRRVPRRGRGGVRHQRRRQRPRRGLPRAARRSEAQPFDVVAETIKKTAFKITRMGQLVAREASRRLGVPFGIVDLSPRADARAGRHRRAHSGGDGPGALRHARHHGGAGAAQRRGEEGRRHGHFARRRAFRRVHPRVARTRA